MDWVLAVYNAQGVCGARITKQCPITHLNSHTRRVEAHQLHPMLNLAVS